MHKYLFIIFTLFSLNSFSETQPPIAPQHDFLKHSLGFGIGQSLLFGDYSELGADDLSYDLYYSYRASYTFSFLLNAHLDKYQENTSSIKVMSVNTSMKAKIFDFDSFAPFWSLGFGFYWPKAELLSTNSKKISPKTKATFGLNASLGIDLKLNRRFSIGFLSHFHYPFKAKLDDGVTVDGGYLKLLIQPSFSF